MSDRGTSLADRIKGGLYGVAVGDALGGTTEFMSAKEIRRKYGYLTDIVGGGVWDLEPGEVTDDTMMTLCVAEGILDCPDDPMASIGKRFLAWYRSDPKDIGNIIRRAFARYDGHWFEAAFLADQDLGRSAGNGSLMRCLPVALAYADPDRVDRMSRMQSKMTHYDERCNEACGLYNRIALRLLNGEELHPALAAETQGTPYASALAEAPDCEPTGFVVDTLRWALYCLQHRLRRRRAACRQSRRRQRHDRRDCRRAGGRVLRLRRHPGRVCGHHLDQGPAGRRVRAADGAAAGCRPLKGVHNLWSPSFSFGPKRMLSADEAFVKAGA